MTVKDRRIVALFCAVFIVGSGWVASADVGREVRHGRVVRAICAHPNHWYREHGISIIVEGCEGA